MHDFNLLWALLTIAAVVGVLLGSTAFLIYVERKIAAYVQDRLGPNRVGPAGLYRSTCRGMISSLKRNFSPSATDWNRPAGPTRLGPRRSWTPESRWRRRC